MQYQLIIVLIKLNLISFILDIIVPATLSPLNSFTTTGLPFNIADWGDIEGGITPRYLRTARVHAISLMQCSQIVSRGRGVRFIVVPFTHICTQSTPPALIKPVSKPISPSSIQL